MTNISNISANLLQSYVTYQSKDGMGITSKEMFQMLSIQIGGDSESIDKDDLDNYIEDAEDGIVDINEKELNGLKTLQKNWDEISSGDDSITFSDMQNYSGLLVSIVTSGFASEDETEEPSSQNDLNSYIIAETLGLSSAEEASQSDLTTFLDVLLSGNTDENDDENGDMIDTITNLLAVFGDNSTVSVQA